MLSRFSRPIWYGISDRALFPQVEAPRYMEALFRTSADVLQWRERDLPLEIALPLIRVGCGLARETGKIFIVNSLLDVALREGADGAHLTSEQSVEEAFRTRHAVGRTDFLIGKSVHSLEAAQQAQAEGVDYLLLSPVFAPLSKDDDRPPLGIDGLRRIVSKLNVRVFALGGVDRSNASEILGAGVAGIAGISWLGQELAALIGGPGAEA
jgi:thiamine-phosphate pyrophosphorylase